MSELIAALCAFGGGVAVEILRIVELGNIPRSERPETFSDPLFVLRIIALPLLAGGLGYVYQASGSNLTPLVAVNIGASAPLILKSFAAAIPPIAQSTQPKN
jgi:hypothetical protein